MAWTHEGPSVGSAGPADPPARETLGARVADADPYVEPSMVTFTSRRAAPDHVLGLTSRVGAALHAVLLPVLSEAPCVVVIL